MTPYFKGEGVLHKKSTSTFRQLAFSERVDTLTIGGDSGMAPGVTAKPLARFFPKSWSRKSASSTDFGKPVKFRNWVKQILER